MRTSQTFQAMRPSAQLWVIFRKVCVRTDSLGARIRTVAEANSIFSEGETSLETEPCIEQREDGDIHGGD